MSCKMGILVPFLWEIDSHDLQDGNSSPISLGVRFPMNRKLEILVSFLWDCDSPLQKGASFSLISLGV